ncbi:hypothetical protein llap_59 [Limosa lapponica baueri]|uniref:Uncharacterized protein n=1 Tax=Limosa lapponica baueri TaxID=1758121 RepID=A0A2I0UUD6_LIMLA|nr:hypothetical protein llap_59 [Limosa lapponica baueri]
MKSVLEAIPGSIGLRYRTKHLLSQPTRPCNPQLPDGRNSPQSVGRQALFTGRLDLLTGRPLFLLLLFLLLVSASSTILLTSCSPTREEKGTQRVKNIRGNSEFAEEEEEKEKEKEKEKEDNDSRDDKDKDEEEVVFQVLKQTFHTEGSGGPMTKLMDTPGGTMACREPTLGQRKSVRSKEWQKETIMY